MNPDRKIGNMKEYARNMGMTVRQEVDRDWKLSRRLGASLQE